MHYAGKEEVSTDSSGALTSIKFMQSDARCDIVLDITQTVIRMKRAGIEITVNCSVWFPTHIGLYGNELADKYAKEGTRKEK